VISRRLDEKALYTEIVAADLSALALAGGSLALGQIVVGVGIFLCATGLLWSRQRLGVARALPKSRFCGRVYI